MIRQNPHFYPVILAGGRGTRFWPLSRKRRAKQLLALDGKRTMIQQTVARLRPLAPEERLWVITNEDLSVEIARQLPALPRRHMVAEPVARNTAPAIGLAAFILMRHDPAAVIGMFPSDHVVEDEKGFLAVLKHGLDVAASGDNIVVLGIQPTRPETGYGYIETGAKAARDLLRVRRFTEKPNRMRAEEFLATGRYYWNSGMFLWRADTLVRALREHLSETAPYLEQIAASFGTSQFRSRFRRLYPKCENISVDYAVLEPRSAKGEHASNLFCIPVDVGWNDLGSWAALYEYRARPNNGHAENVVNAARSFALNAEGNYVHAPGKFVATVGVNNLVVVETEDALLVTTRDQAQDVGKVVKYLDEKKLSTLV
ncbi:MAG TPA: mannose-1-phosphate guanylyltransferase [Terriglobales bacterium]|nr:mannose-1-phosphate guanylyltransferase [Terriglobales bacterium]